MAQFQTDYSFYTSVTFLLALIRSIYFLERIETIWRTRSGRIAKPVIILHGEKITATRVLRKQMSSPSVLICARMR